MTLQKLIEEQLSAIKTEEKNLTRKTLRPQDLTRPTIKLRDRIAGIELKIKGLSRQRDNTVKRLDAAIAEEKKLRDRLENELSTITSPLPDEGKGGAIDNPKNRSAKAVTRQATKRNATSAKAAATKATSKRGAATGASRAEKKTPPKQG